MEVTGQSGQFQRRRAHCADAATARGVSREKIAGLLADREFIGEEWLGWLIEQDIPFVTRVKENMIATLPDGRALPLKQMFRSIGAGCPSLPYAVTLGKGLRLTVQAKRTFKGLVIVAAHGMESQPAEPVNLYRKRWKIECAFACLKRKGFELEDTHLKDAARLQALMVIAAIAYAWAFVVGQLAPTPQTKNHGYKANCTFTLGKQTLIHAANFTEKITKLTAYAFSVLAVNRRVV